MPLIHIPFINGQNEAIDEKLLPNGWFSSASNVRLSRDGRWEKRRPFATVTPPSGVFSTLRAAALNDQRLIVCSGAVDSGATHYQCSVWSPSRSAWVPGNRYGVLPKWTAPRRIPTSANRDGSAVQQDVAVIDNQVCLVYGSVNGAGVPSVHVEVYDLQTRARLFVGTIADATSPRVVPMGTKFMVLHVFSTISLQISELDTATLTLGSPTVITGLVATHDYDLAPYSSTAVLIAYQSGATTITVTVWQSGSALASTTITGENPAIQGADGETVNVAYVSGASVYLRTFTIAAGAFVAGAGPTLVGANPAWEVRIGLCRYSPTQVAIVIPGDTGNGYVSRLTVVNTAAHGAPSAVAIYEFRSASKPLAVDGDVYFWATNRSAFGRTYCLVSLNPAAPTAGVHTWMCRGIALDSAQNNWLSSFVTTGRPNFECVWALPYIASGAPDASSSKSEAALGLVEYGPLDRFQTAQLGGELYLSGGLQIVFDGAVAYERGFVLQPEVRTLTPGSAGGSLTAGASYQYVAVREWYDAQGNRHQSTPSDPVTVTLGGADNRVTVTVAPTTASYRDTSSATQETVHIYRTEANGSIFYRTTSEDGEQVPFNTGAPLTFVDTNSDATIRVNPVVYTQGERGLLSGPLQHDPAPPCRYLWAGKDRLIAGGLEIPNEVRWSKRLYSGEPVEWSESVVFRATVDAPVTAVAMLDERWLIFTETSVFETYGDGPDDNGVGEFPTPRRLPSEAGCIDWRSVVETPDGLMFQGARDRIYLLPRGGGPPIWIGQPVRSTLEGFVADAAITGACYSPGDNTVCFLADSDSETFLLVYDLRSKQWTVDTTAIPTGRGPAIWGGELAFCGSTSAYRRDTSGWTEAGSHVPSRVETGQIRPGGLNANVRVRKVALLGEYRGNCTLTLQVSYDDGDTFTDSVVWELTGLTVGEQVQRVWHLPQQKCGSLKFRIDDQSGTPSGGVVLNGISLEVFQRKGVPRLRDAFRG